jgi:O-antigen/teichoic acid export membrane protein
MLPLLTLNSLRQAALRGLNRVVIGQLPEMLIQPMVFISLIGAAYLFLDKSLSTPQAVGMGVFAAGVAFIVGTRFLHKTLPRAVKKTSPAYKTRMWARSALPLLFIAIMQVINNRIDTIMLGAIKGAEPVGIYAVANRGAELIAFILLSVNNALAPTVASLYAARDMRQLQSVTTKSARMILLISLPFGLGLIVFGHWFLLLFGQDFMKGETALTILSIGQIINVATGSVGLLLVMTGHERDVAISVGISALLNIIMNAFLIPKWGIEGAAIATTTSMVVWNILLAILVYKRLGIHSTALGRIGISKRI